MEEAKCLYDYYKDLIIDNELYLLNKKEIIKKISEMIELSDIEENSPEYHTLYMIVTAFMNRNKELFIVVGNEDDEL